MDRREIEKIFDLSKSVKSDMIVVYGNHIIGTDENATYFKLVDYNNIENISIVYVYNDMSKFLKQLIMLDSIEVKDDIMSSSVGGKILIQNNIILNKVIRGLNYILNINDNFKPDYYMDELEKNKTFNEIISKKVDEGISLFKINRKYILSLFKGLLPINKKDKISLRIFDNNDKFLSVFTINKNKPKININVYIMYLHI